MSWKCLKLHLSMQSAVKKEIVDTGTTESESQSSSPAKKVLKRKRRKSRTVSESSAPATKEKRTFTVTASENPMDLDSAQPSTSGLTKLPAKPAKLVQKKMIMKRGVVLKKKTKRISSNDA